MAKGEAPDGFEYIFDSGKRIRMSYHSRTYLVGCLSCGRRIWGSGLGVGAHRRACV